MRSWVLAASLLAAAATTGAQAADLYDGPPPPRYGSAYEDPRYADIYKYPGPAPYAVPPPRSYPGPYAGPPRSRASASTAMTTTARSVATTTGRGAIPISIRAGRTRPTACRARQSRRSCCAAAGKTSTMATCRATSQLFTRAVRAAACSRSPSTAAPARSSVPSRWSRAGSVLTPTVRRRDAGREPGEVLARQFDEGLGRRAGALFLRCGAVMKTGLRLSRCAGG